MQAFNYILTLSWKYLWTDEKIWAALWAYYHREWLQYCLLLLLQELTSMSFSVWKQQCGIIEACCEVLYELWLEISVVSYQQLFFPFLFVSSQLLYGLENRFSVWLYVQTRNALWRQTYVPRAVLIPIMKNYASMTHVSRIVFDKLTVKFNVKKYNCVMLNIRTGNFFFLILYWIMLAVMGISIRRGHVDLGI